MPISQKKYIKINSAVGGQSVVSQKELIARIFTESEVVPVGKVIEFSGGSQVALSEVGKYFGITSKEYDFASKYFSFISKKGFSPKSISFARLVSADVPATVIGDNSFSSLESLKAITDGKLNISVNGTPKNYTAINLSSANSFADVATKITEKITADGLEAEYNEGLGRFFIKTTATGAGQVLSGVSGDVADATGLSKGEYSEGSGAKTPVSVLSESEASNNNFFSFMFMKALSNDEIVEIAKWTQTANVSYMYSLGLNADNFTEIQELVKDYDGVCLTYDAFDAFAEFMPMSVIASTDYNKPNATTDLMYQTFDGVEPSVETDEDSAELDALGINYYGATQQVGRKIAFYQNGVLQGSIKSIGVYAGEAWLKDALFAQLLNLRLGLDTLPANNTGKSLVLNVMSNVIDLAKTNGVISVGKTLSANAKAYISQLTDDADAWMTIQSNGFWVDADIEEYTEDGITKYKLSYLLVYAKGDSINFIEGRDILI